MTEPQVEPTHGQKIRIAGGDLGWILGRPPWKVPVAEARQSGRKIPPHAPGTPGIGHMRRLRGDRVGFLLDAMSTCGDTFVIEVPWMRATIFTHPDAVKHILQQHHENYGKQTRGFDQLRIFLGNGLLTAEGSFWLRQRRIAQPAFHKQRLASFASTMVKAADDLVSAWTASGAPKVDVAREMMRVTLRIVSETLLGRDVSGEADALGVAITHLLENMQQRMALPVDLPLSWPTPMNKRYHEAAGVIDKVVLDVIADRRRNGSQGRIDLLQLLMDARDEDTGEGMSDRQLRDEAMTIFLAGHETTANALAWTFFLLSRHPSARRRLEEELDRVLGDRNPTLEDLPKLEWTKMVVQEAMRLYPPAPMVGRNAIADDEIQGWFVPKGTLVFVAPLLTHRHSKFWDDPEGFDPERFSPERSAGRPPLAYLPFGGGPRLCIGNAFAMMEAQLLLATIARRVRLDAIPGHDVRPEPLITLRPHGGTLPMTLHARSPAP